MEPIYVSWKSAKQIVMATSTNHVELLAFHEVSREVVENDGKKYWLTNVRMGFELSRRSSTKTMMSASTR